MECSKLLLPGVALLACVGFLTSQQTIREAAATDIAYVRHEIREEVHGLESWLRHPHSKHHPEAVDAAGPAAWRDLGRDVDLFLKRIPRSWRLQPGGAQNSNPSKTRKSCEEEHRDQATHKTHTRHNANPGKLICDGKSIQHEIIEGRPGDGSTNLDHAAPRES